MQNIKVQEINEIEVYEYLNSNDEIRHVLIGYDDNGHSRSDQALPTDEKVYFTGREWRRINAEQRATDGDLTLNTAKYALTLLRRKAKAGSLRLIERRGTAVVPWCLRQEVAS
jgi:hypothetical protein